MKIVGIYLAAGNSSRMGSHKLALPVGTMTVGSLALETALKSQLDEIFVITKDTDDADWLPEEMKSDARCSIIKCSTAHEGQSESLRCGIQQAQAHHADAVIIMLADQPFITVQMIEEMILCIRPRGPRAATAPGRASASRQRLLDEQDDGVGLGHEGLPGLWIFAVCVNSGRQSLAAEHVGQIVGDGLVELVVATALGVAVGAPPAELRGVPEAPPFHVVVGDLDHEVGSQRGEAEVLALAPAALSARARGRGWR